MHVAILCQCRYIFTCIFTLSSRGYHILVEFEPRGLEAGFCLSKAAYGVPLPMYHIIIGSFLFTRRIGLNPPSRFSQNTCQAACWVRARCLFFSSRTISFGLHDREIYRNLTKFYRS
jgi:hypothetical protein